MNQRKKAGTKPAGAKLETAAAAVPASAVPTSSAAADEDAPFAAAPIHVAGLRGVKAAAAFALKAALEESHQKGLSTFLSAMSPMPPGNLTDFCPAEPSTGKRSKGDLVFNSNFECGNLGSVQVVSSFEYDLFIRPDTCDSKYLLWFYFTVKNTAPGQRVIFNIVNPYKTKSLYRSGMAPVVKSTSREHLGWVRLPSNTTFYYRCPDHRRHYVISFVFLFDYDKDTYSFAYCYPYDYTQLQKYLDRLDACNYHFYKRQMLTRSVHHRHLDMLTITEPCNNAVGKERVKTVVVTARVHPGETPSSFVCQGFIDFLCSTDKKALQLRKNAIFFIIPMLNPDGVFYGNYRTNLVGFDLNRQWHDPNEWYHPTISAARKLVMEISADKRYDLRYILDLHAHTTHLNTFMYGNVYGSAQQRRSDKQTVYPRCMDMNSTSGDFSLKNTSYNNKEKKEGTARRYFGQHLTDVLPYTVETSMFGFECSRAVSGVRAYTQESYQQVGANLAKSLIHAMQLWHG